ncbi:MAG: YraN family protein [Candidatus Kerfeldbacteria bacterium]
MNNNKSLGNWGEDLAVKYLLQKSYIIMYRHWQKREGEIDIVAYDKNDRYLVFVEVKTRISSQFGSPEESLSYKKKQSLGNIIMFYLQEAGYKNRYRFDLITIKKTDHVKITHYKNLSLE